MQNKTSGHVWPACVNQDVYIWVTTLIQVPAAGMTGIHEFSKLLHGIWRLLVTNSLEILHTLGFSKHMTSALMQAEAFHLKWRVTIIYVII